MSPEQREELTGKVQKIIRGLFSFNYKGFKWTICGIFVREFQTKFNFMNIKTAPKTICVFL